MEPPGSDRWVLTLAVLLELGKLSWAQTDPAPVSHTAEASGGALCLRVRRSTSGAKGNDGFL